VRHERVDQRRGRRFLLPAGRIGLLERSRYESVFAVGERRFDIFAQRLGNAVRFAGGDPGRPGYRTAEELEAEVRAIMAETGASSPKDMGKVMGVASKRLSGRAEGRLVSETVKRLLNS